MMDKDYYEKSTKLGEEVWKLLQGKGVDCELALQACIQVASRAIAFGSETEAGVERAVESSSTSLMVLSKLLYGQMAETGFNKTKQ